MNEKLLVTCLDIFRVLQERSVHEVSEQEIVRVDLKLVISDLFNSLPVTRLHRFVSHQLKERASCVEVVDGFPKVFVGLPFLERSRQLTTPA
jgi:hypothetical protein